MAKNINVDRKKNYFIALILYKQSLAVSWADEFKSQQNSIL